MFKQGKDFHIQGVGMLLSNRLKCCYDIFYIFRSHCTEVKAAYCVMQLLGL